MPLNSNVAEMFIETEISTAELFAHLAIDADNDVSRERHLRNARKAFDSASYFLPLTAFRRKIENAFEKRLSMVREKLRPFDDDPA